LGGLVTGGGDKLRIFHRWRRRHFMVGVSGVRSDESALEQCTRWTGVFSLVLQGSATSHVISAGLLAPKTNL